MYAVAENIEPQPDPALIFPGPVALVAGPGSGKTTRIARRIKHLIEEDGVNPDEITVITFTVGAARNMKERLTRPAEAGMPDVTVPPDLHPLICTMHSLGMRIITENTHRLGIGPDFSLLASPQLREVIFKDAARLCGESFDFGRECDRCKRTVGEAANGRQRRVFDIYQRILTACNAIDYDDQILMACQLIRQQTDVRQKWQEKARHLLVDEYQDINKAQLGLIGLLSESNPSGLFVVGDDDQSIYSFRGGDPRYIRDFVGHFGGPAQVVPIADCFRCQPHVIHAAHGFIESFNPRRIPKPPPERMPEEGPLVKVHSVPSDAREAEIVASIIEDALEEGDVLVLVPKPDYADFLKLVLNKRRIAFDAPKTRLNEATAVFDALKRWLDNPGNNLALRQLFEAVANSGALGILGPKARRKDKVAARQIALSRLSELWTDVLNNGNSLHDALRDRSAADPLYDALNDAVVALGQATEGSLLEFAERTFAALKPWTGSKRMLDELAAVPIDVQAPQDGDARLARIMTMRLSKGLQAETVIVLGLEEGAFPAAAPGTAEFEEEARLFYVSMTRAKRMLHLFHATNRSGGLTFKSKSYGLQRSPFLEGLSKEHSETQYHQSASKRRARKKRAVASSRTW